MARTDAGFEVSEDRRCLDGLAGGGGGSAWGGWRVGGRTYLLPNTKEVSR